MIAVLQRVSKAKVTTAGKDPVSIGAGFLVLIGVAQTDTSADATRLGRKLSKLRLMADENGKLNQDLSTAGGELLLVSQFTLIADISSGNRPSFIHAAKGQRASKLFNLVVSTARQNLGSVKTGFFGQEMEVELTNDGPVTVVLDTNKF